MASGNTVGMSKIRPLLLALLLNASAQAQTSASGACTSLAGTICPRNAKARTSVDPACSCASAGANVCLESFSPAALLATGKCA